MRINFTKDESLMLQEAIVLSTEDLSFWGIKPTQNQPFMKRANRIYLSLGRNTSLLILPGDFQFLLTALKEYAEQFKDDENEYVEPAFAASKLYRKIEKRIPKKQRASLR
jgi:hypothetical protein